MSQALILKVEDLERRVRALEARLKGVERDPPEGARAVHKGFGRWYVENGGVRVNTEPLARDEAERLAGELNAAA